MWGNLRALWWLYPVQQWLKVGQCWLQQPNASNENADGAKSVVVDGNKPCECGNCPSPFWSLGVSQILYITWGPFPWPSVVPTVRYSVNNEATCLEKGKVPEQLQYDIPLGCCRWRVSWLWVRCVSPLSQRVGLQPDLSAPLWTTNGPFVVCGVLSYVNFNWHEGQKGKPED